MAKKEDFDLDDDMDFNFDDDFGSDDPFSPQSGQGRNPVVQTSKSFLRGAADTAKSVQFARDVAKEAFPKSFSTTLDTVDQYTNGIGQIANTVSKEVAPLKRELKRAGSIINRAIPSPWQSKLEAMLKEDKSGTQNAQVDLEEAAVQSGMGDVASPEQLEALQDQQTEKVVDMVTEEQFRTKISQQIAGIQRNGDIQRQYTLKVHHNMMRKGLELQLRSVFIQRRLLEITDQSAKESSELMRQIVKNTALPDIQKEQQSESFKRLARERLMGMAQQNIQDWSRPYIRNVTTSLQKILTQKIRSATDAARNAGDQAEAAAEALAAANSMGINTNEMGAELAGGGLMSALGKYAGSKFAKRNPRAREMSNAFSTFNYVMGNAPQFLSKKGRQYSEQHMGTFLGDLAGAFDQPFNRETKIRGSNLESIADVGSGSMSYQSRMLRAAEEILPGYMSRMLQVMERRDNPNAQRTVYDNERGIFTTMGEQQGYLADRLLNSDQVKFENLNYEFLIKDLDPGGTLTKKDRAELTGYFSKNSQNKNWTYDPLSWTKGEINGVSPKLAVKLKRLAIEKYGFKQNQKGDYGYSWTEGGDKLADHQKLINQARGAYKSSYNDLHGLAATGNVEALLSMGAVRYNPETGGLETNDEWFEGRRDAFTRGRKHKVGNGPAPRNDMFGSGDGAFDSGPAPTDQASVGRSWRLFGRRAEGNSKTPPVSSQRGMVNAIHDQTNQLLEFLANSDNQVHTIEAINDLHTLLASGVPTYGVGTMDAPDRPSLLRRGLGATGRGARRLGKFWWRTATAPLRGAKWGYDKLLKNPLARFRGKQWNRIKGLFQRGKKKLDELKTDVYVYGSEGLRQALDAAGFTDGRYVDMQTGKVLKSIKDVTGAVMDTVKGKIVLTDEEFQGGLLNSMGQRIKRNLFKGLGNLTSNVMDMIRKPFMAPINLVKNAFGTAKKWLTMPPDVYLANDMTKPVMYGELMYKGMYFSATKGKIIRSPEDIDGDVAVWDTASKEKRVVITAEQITTIGICDWQGKPLKGFIAKWRDRIKGAASFIGKAMNPMNAIRWAKDKAGKVGGAIKSGLSGLFGGLNKGVDGATSARYLSKIYSLLYRKFNGMPLDPDGSGASMLNSAGEKVAGAWSRARDWVKSKMEGKDAQDPSRIRAFLSKLNPMDPLRRAFAAAKDPKTREEKAQGYIDALKGRAGSWYNRMSEKAGQSKIVQTVKEKAKKGPNWLGVIMSGFGLLTGVLTSIKSKFLSWGSSLWKLLGGIRTAILAKKAGDAVGDIADLATGGGRGKGGLLRRGARAVGKGLKYAVKHPFKTVGKGLWAGAKLAGRAAMFGGGLLARGALMLLANPLVLGGAIVAGVAAYGIYKLYKAYKNRLDVMQKMRLTQYGFDLTDKDQCAKVLALEEVVMKKTKIDANGVATVGALDFPSLIQEFDIRLDAQRSVSNWAHWFSRRFQPVFVKNVEALHQLDPKAQITDVKGTLADGLKPEYARRTRINIDRNQSPYFVDSSPFAEQSLVIGTDAIDSYIDAVVKEYADAEKTMRQTKRKEVGANTELKIITPNAGPQMAPNQGQDKAAPADASFYSPSQMKMTAGTITGDKAKDMKLMSMNSLDEVTAARMKIYGMSKLSKMNIQTIINLERGLIADGAIAIDVTMSKFTGDMTKVEEKYMPMFGVSAADKQTSAGFKFWFEHRFLPVFLNYITKAAKLGKGSDLIESTRGLKPALMLEIVNFMSSSTTEVDKRSVSVWTINAWPFYGESANIDPALLQPNINYLQKAAKEEVIKETHIDDLNRTSWTAFNGTNLEGSRAAVSAQGLAGDMAAILRGTKTQTQADMASAGKSPLDGASNNYQVGQGAVGDYTASLPATLKGIPDPTEALAKAKGNRDGMFNALKPLFAHVAKMVGVDPGAMAAFASIESGFDPNAKAKTSSATGLFQFIDSTWKSMWDKIGSKYGVQGYPDPRNPIYNAIAGAEFMKENMGIFKNKTGRNPNLGEMYLQHFLGPSGAAIMMKQNPNTTMAQLAQMVQSNLGPGKSNWVRASMAANSSIMGPGTTVQQMGAWASDKISKHSKYSSAMGSSIDDGSATPTAPGGSNDGGNQYESGDVRNLGHGASTGATETAPSAAAGGAGSNAPTTGDGASDPATMPAAAPGYDGDAAPGEGATATAPSVSKDQARTIAKTNSPNYVPDNAAAKDPVALKRQQQRAEAQQQMEERQATQAQAANRRTPTVAGPTPEDVAGMIREQVKTNEILQDIHHLLESRGQQGATAPAPSARERAYANTTGQAQNIANSPKTPFDTSRPGVTR